jgi:aspartate ammonia-lyase
MTERTEKDLLGEKVLPADALWGIHTVRALENFEFSAQRAPLALVHALAEVKKACALANHELGYLSAEKSEAIVRAADEITDGRWDQAFPLDALQGGAGTSTNMNVNEVIANRAIEILGGRRGDYSVVHPLEDVNRHQSTNDVYPTALKVALIRQLRRLSPAIAALQGAFQRREKEFASILKMGRTEMQSAVPITLGAEFSTFAEAIGRDRWRVFKCEERLRVINLGGTAVGTGLAAPQRFIFLASEKLREGTGLGLARAENLMDPTANADVFVEVSGILKAHAASLRKIAGDLRLLHFLGEIRLPALQAGSSIMPGKINPVLMEAAIQIALKVMANDFLVTEAASLGTLQINEFLPLLALAMLESLEMMVRLNEKLVPHIDGIQADAAVCRERLENHPTLVTAFLPEIGYDRATALAQEFAASGEKNMRRFLEERLGRELVEKVLTPQHLMALGFKDREHERNAKG